MNTRTLIANLQVGDIVAQHGGRFRVVEAPYPSLSHAPVDPATGWKMGPPCCAVAEAVCISGEIRGYFKPGSTWTLQGNHHAPVHKVNA